MVTPLLLLDPSIAGMTMRVILTDAGRDLIESGFFAEESDEAIWIHLMEETLAGTDIHLVDKTCVRFDFNGPMIARGTWRDTTEIEGKGYSKLDVEMLWIYQDYVGISPIRRLLRNDYITMDRAYEYPDDSEPFESDDTPELHQPTTGKTTAAAALSHLIATGVSTWVELEDPAASCASIREHARSLCTALDAYLRAKES